MPASGARVECMAGKSVPILPLQSLKTPPNAGAPEIEGVAFRRTDGNIATCAAQKEDVICKDPNSPESKNLAGLAGFFGPMAPHF